MAVRYQIHLQKKITHLVVKDKSQVTGKIKKAMKLNIPIYTIEDFLKIIYFLFVSFTFNKFLI